MRHKCWVEVVDNKPVRIFRTLKDATNSPAWDEKRVKEEYRDNAVSSIRKQVYDRADNKCEGCGAFITWTFHMHEKVFKSKGGEVSLENSVALCPNCHLGKDGAHGNRLPRFGEKNV